MERENKKQLTSGAKTIWKNNGLFLRGDDMNAVRERVLSSITDFKGYAEHKDLISFVVCSESFMDWEDEANGIEADFAEVIVVVEKDWLFDYMGIENPREYLQNEYTSDDSINWFDAAAYDNKVLMVSFN